MDANQQYTCANVYTFTNESKKSASPSRLVNIPIDYHVPWHNVEMVRKLGITTYAM